MFMNVNVHVCNCLNFTCLNGFVSYDNCKLCDLSDQLLHPQDCMWECICMCLFICKDTNLNIYVSDQKILFIEDFPVSSVFIIYWCQYYKYQVFQYAIVNIVLYLLITGILIMELSHLENVGYKWNAPAEPISHSHTFILQTRPFLLSGFCFWVFGVLKWYNENLHSAGILWCMTCLLP
jgi:hypothetical protein